VCCIGEFFLWLKAPCWLVQARISVAGGDLQSALASLAHLMSRVQRALQHEADVKDHRRQRLRQNEAEVGRAAAQSVCQSGRVHTTDG
jgi:hypothetical protein